MCEDEKTTDRRWELIHKQICDKLTEEETQELDTLNSLLPKHGMYHTDRKLKSFSNTEDVYYD